jgi:ABC-type antimicrobial peptide transport system permease subunit
MFKNHFKIAWRTLWKHKIFSAINVLGLAIGISASLVIYLIASYDTSFDKFEKDRDRIYRVVWTLTGQDLDNHITGITYAMPAAVKKEIPGLELVAPFSMFNNAPNISVPVADKEKPAVFNYQKEFVYADENYFNLIDYKWLAGSSKTSLQQPYQTVLTESAAALYFPNLQPDQILGKHLNLDDTIAVTVTGIVKDITANTDFTFKAFVSLSTFETPRLRSKYFDNWESSNGASQLYVKLEPGASPDKIQKALTALYYRNAPKKPGDNYEVKYFLQPLADMHFSRDYNTYSIPKASKDVLFGLLAVALFLLLLGCINFINLTTAQSAQRAKEIGIRKTIGSSKKQVVFQFLSEALLLTFCATLLSVFLTPLILKAFSGFVPEAVKFNILQQPAILLFLGILIIIVTLLSGFYPAMVLSSYKPVSILKSQGGGGITGTGNAWLRKSLTVSQFVIAQFFVMATILVGKQISFSLNKDLGFKKDAIAYMGVDYNDNVQSHKTTLANMLSKIPEIKMVSLGYASPSSGNASIEDMKYRDGKKEITIVAEEKFGDTNYIKLYGIKLLAGRNLSASDTVKEILINENYAHVLGFQNLQNAIGKYIDWDNKLVPIVGVVGDFHQKSLHEPIKPLLIASDISHEYLVSFLLQPQNAEGTTWKSAIDKAEKAFKQVYPKGEYWSGFFDQDLAKWYTQEKNLSKLLDWATALAVGISCLGLLGLVIYTTTHRRKEIGVRKVLGASVTQMVMLLSKDFVLLVLIAFVIAAPLAWIGGNKWLESFAYRTAVSWWVFALAGLLMIFVALITLSFQTIKAAVANPVKSLRTE